MDNLLNEDKTNEAPIENKKPKQDKNVKRKRIISMCLVLALIFSVVGTGISYFSDKTTLSNNATIGKVDVTVDMSGVNLKNEDGYDILNPGDVRPVSFTIHNDGNKSVEYVTIVTLTTSNPMHDNYYRPAFESMGYSMLGEGEPADKLYFGEVYSSEYELYWKGDVVAVEGYGHYPKKGVAPVGQRYINDFCTQIVYVIDSGILNGNMSLDEQEIEWVKKVEKLDLSQFYIYSDDKMYVETYDYSDYIEGIGYIVYCNPDRVYNEFNKIFVIPEAATADYGDKEGTKQTIEYVCIEGIEGYCDTVYVSSQVKGFINTVFDNKTYQTTYTLYTAEEIKETFGIEILYYDDFSMFEQDHNSPIEAITDLEYQSLSDEEKTLYEPCTDSKTYDMVLLFDLYSDNLFQGSVIDVTVDVRAKQHRNAEDGWGLMGMSQVDIAGSIFNYAYDYQQRLVLMGVKDGINTDEITEITIPEGVEVIGEEAFMELYNLEKVNLPSTIKEIDDYAFAYCSALNEINFPEGLEEIGYNAFDCTGLITVKLPDSLKFISPMAFQNCSSITELDLGDGVQYVGAYAFQGTYALTHLDIPASIKYIQYDAFYGMWLETLTFEEGCTKVFNGMFRYTEPLHTVTFPSTLLEIDDGAFAGCQNLANVTIPDSVEILGNEAFFGCDSITSIRLPKGLKEWKGATFSLCHGLTNVIIPDGFTYIPSSAFYGCTALKSINLPNSIEKIEYTAFQSSGLKSFTFPKNVKYVGRQAFDYCIDLKSITIPKSVRFDTWAFSNSGLETVVFEHGCARVADRMFENCSSLKNVTFASTIVSIGERAFQDCTSLTQLDFPENLTLIDSRAFNGCTGLTSIVFPENTVDIGAWSFQNCTNLTEITFLNRQPYIWNDAFKSSVNIKTTIYSINAYVISSYYWAGSNRSVTNIFIEQ